MRRRTCSGERTKRSTGRSDPGATASRSRTSNTEEAPWGLARRVVAPAVPQRRGGPRAAVGLPDPGDLDLGRDRRVDLVVDLVLAPRGAAGVAIELVVERLLADP